MKIGTKLVVSFLVISLVGSLIGYTGYEGSNRIVKDFDMIADETAPELVVLGKIESLSHRLQLEAVSHVLINSQLENSKDTEELEEFKEVNLKLDAAIFELKKLEGRDIEEQNTEEEEEEDRFVEHVTELKSELHSSSLRLMEASDPQTILALKQELEDAEDRIEEAIEDRIASERQELERRQIKADETAISTTSLILGTSFLIVVFSIVLGLAISKNVTTPIRKLTDAAKRLEKGDFGEKLEVSGDDEISELSRIFNKMTVSLSKNFELQKELALSRENLKKQKLETVGLMAASLSHNLRNPLTVIKGMCDLLKTTFADKMDETTKHRFSVMDETILNMVDQIEGVLGFVQNRPLSLKKHSILEILESVNKKLVKPSGVEIKLPKNDVEINCDFQKLQVVFTNIVSNAIHAIGKDGYIEIRIKTANESAIVEIEDSGSGIDDEVLDKIFEPLFTTKNFGTGLGLSACKNIVEQHGGTISVKNNPTTFMISLPRNQTEEKRIDKNESLKT